ncbi:Bifunctional protein Aas [Rosistilla carotiformis]|uniref:Bifunctional protein Aas n=1 Tax=Rosistilla carotiformis TaxID=2528017 RepID=A0A518JS53_9BACT|nr:AMP-binding protein [Rosistilla carotiformis]QDV68366.1 Bifunctional protein Aas [Rosistilla carotiformis]
MLLQILLAIVLSVIALHALLVLAIFMQWEWFVRLYFRGLFACLYRKRVVGLENLPAEGGYLLCSNHVSWLDGSLMLWFIPRPVHFIVDASNFRGKFMFALGKVFGSIMMTSSPKSIARALKAGRDGLNQGKVIGLFPEGGISRNGQLQAFRPGMEKILKGTEAPIVPVYLDGMWGSIFSNSGGRFLRKMPQLTRRTLTLYIGKPLPTQTPVATVREKVQQLNAEASKQNGTRTPVLTRRLIRSLRSSGRGIKSADSTGTELSGKTLLVRILALRKMLRREILADNEVNVGILLPPSVPAVAVNFAMAIDRRVGVNLNYTVSSDVMNKCIHTAGIKHVLTSRRFMEKFDFNLDAEMVYLEDIKDRVGWMDKLSGILGGFVFPARLTEWLLGLQNVQGDDILTVIFTSGSTGTPKGVMLTYANIGHNVDAIDSVVRLKKDDTVLGVLPFFHSFGYAITLWGVNALPATGAYHFNPLDAKQVGKLAEKYKATVMLGTPTFLRGYLRRIEPEQFKTLDVVVVGAEKMPIALADQFEKRFGVRPVEGYGATELSPLVSVNVPPSRSVEKFQIDCRECSVGRPVNGVAAKVVSPDDGEDLPADTDGLLMISGANVMKGYMGRDDLTCEAIRDGWYATGDVAKIDKEGFIHITGRVSRFSKIGGEMVPHIQVEEELAKALCEGDEDDQIRVMVTAVPDSKKGERLVVLHLTTDKDPDDLRKQLAAAGLPNIYIPSRDSFVEVSEIPLLGTGKLDLKAAQDLALELTTAVAR